MYTRRSVLRATMQTSLAQIGETLAQLWDSANAALHATHCYAAGFCCFCVLRRAMAAGSTPTLAGYAGLAPVTNGFHDFVADAIV
jgi:hypothetical protein